MTSDPNRAEDEEYVVRLIGQVVTVSVETMKLVAALPAFEPLEQALDAKAGAAEQPCTTQAEADAAHHHMVMEEETEPDLKG